MPEYADAPDDVVALVRPVATALPEVDEEQAWADATTDWDEMVELLTGSQGLLAPRRLVAQVDRPEP